MRITYRGDYALKAILDLSLNYDNGLVTIHEMAKRIDTPVKFLEQVLLDLKRGGFVESRRGKVGGYMLARDPREIKVGEVVRFIDGSIDPIACTEKSYSQCGEVYKCVFRPIWQQVAERISGIIDHVSFADLRSTVLSRESVPSYSI